MSDFHGQFCWYELMTSDVEAAKAFYGGVLGWAAAEATPTYSLWTSGLGAVGGLMAVPQEAADMGAKPGWMGYLAVDDVDAHTVRLKEAGGTVHRAPSDIPGVGRFAVVADPQAAGFVMMTPIPPEQAPPPIGLNTPGQIGWRELVAADGPSAFDFYGELFGWTKADAFDMGAMGLYQLFATGAEPVGGVMTKPLGYSFPPHWTYYFNVEDIDAAKARLEAGGGTVLMGPNQVPTGHWTVQALDPQGAKFAIVGPRL